MSIKKDEIEDLKYIILKHVKDYPDQFSKRLETIIKYNKISLRNLKRVLFCTSEEAYIFFKREGYNDDGLNAMFCEFLRRKRCQKKKMKKS